MKVLITGGAGFIGTNYAYYRFKYHLEDNICVLDKLTYAGRKENLEPLMKESRFKFYQADLVDKNAVFDLFKKEKFDAVVNFAAESHVDRSIAEPSVFIMTNVISSSFDGRGLW